MQEVDAKVGKPKNCAPEKNMSGETTKSGDKERRNRLKSGRKSHPSRLVEKQNKKGRNRTVEKPKKKKKKKKKCSGEGGG